VISNLVNNAAKFTDPGGRIDITVEREASLVRVVVQDNGIGIPHDRLASVFDMFVQVDSSIERRQGGLGIGLTLVRSIVDLHGGTIEARSPGPGRGSTFVMTLPVAAAPAEIPLVEDAGAPRGLRFLVVDDNTDSAESLALLLRVLGNHAETATSGERALEIAPRLRPDVVLCDLAMPGMSGFETARRLRAMEGRTGRLKLVALTGYGASEDRRLSREAGFDEHLIKPIDLAKLQALVGSLSGVASPPP
jgi:CheY-like chemotaxis protein